MGAHYSGATVLDTTFLAPTYQDASNNLATVLAGNGWSVLSGYGTSDCQLLSGATPQGSRIRLRILQTGLVGNPYSLMLGDADGLLYPIDPTTCRQLLGVGAGVQYRILCSPFWVWCWSVGATIPAVGRSWALHTLYVPSNFTSPAAFLVNSDGISSAGSNRGACSTFRQVLGWQYGDPGVNNDLLCGASMLRWVNDADLTVNWVGCMQLFGPPAAANLNTLGPAPRPGQLYFDNSAVLWDPWIGWGNNYNLSTRIRGQLWDCIGSCHTPALDSVDTFDGHSWTCVSVYSAVGGSSLTGSLHVRTA